MYQWRRGATFLLALRDRSGQATGLENVRCSLKRAPNHRPPGDAEPVAAELDVQFIAAANGEAPYWLFTGSPELGEALTVGPYLADARLEVNGVVIQTAPAIIDVLERITVAG